MGFKDGYFRLEAALADAAPTPQTTTAAPMSTEDARRRIEAAIVARQGNGAFRAQALSAFGRRCAISDCDVEATLEAAHVVPYLGEQTNVMANTLLLRADIHTLFDRQLLDIDPLSLRVVLTEPLRASAYASLQNRSVKLPQGVRPADFCRMLETRRTHLAGSGPS